MSKLLQNFSAERIAKVLSRSGVCSRREAERLILQGRISVDGKIIDSPALNVSSENNILFDGNPIPDIEPTRIWRYHKPPGRLTTRKDPEDRPTIFDGLPKEFSNLKTIGRLDMNTEGLLLLTNDGELARYLELPTTGWTRKYRIRVHGTIDTKIFLKLKNRVTIEGHEYGPVIANLERQVGANAWIEISLQEGKNREVRRLMEHFGYTVNRLIRVSFGPFHLGKLPRGQFEEIPPRVLLSNLPSDY
ncbi:MAG: pseudouridine synthase [Alphaproteobacteria bacterium]|jgi:23S rRNA pseudouridine2605 synthase|nr:pseudouridine synthase [Alphaproteobacteria bacterium]PPR14432.1 MAG: Ribosomal large subunit pseudouridine synthase B [Alphaproteobacteria bacterium MarineAlpha12_Bin1]|tara:strand:+ start:10661 stop:11401 length:741 start_codon:yes stop_codon:yes gene_type:complete